MLAFFIVREKNSILSAWQHYQNGNGQNEKASDRYDS